MGIQRTASLAKLARFSDNVVEGLMELVDNWNTIPELGDSSGNVELTDDLLNKQLNELESRSKLKGVEPRALADAISATEIRMV